MIGLSVYTLFRTYSLLYPCNMTAFVLITIQ